MAFSNTLACPLSAVLRIHAKTGKILSALTGGWEQLQHADLSLDSYNYTFNFYMGVLIPPGIYIPLELLMATAILHRTLSPVYYRDVDNVT